MRRKDREVTDRAEIMNILFRCDTIRIGIQGDEFPYVVPVSFGMEIVEDKPIIYFHSAKQGLKLDLLKTHPKVCVEGDIFLKVETTEQGITTRYESIIGTGACEFLSDMGEIKRALHIINEHYGYSDYPLERCRGLAHLCVGKIVLCSITGKRNVTTMQKDDES